MAGQAREDIVLNGEAYKVFRSNNPRGRDLRGTDQPKVVTDQFNDADLPLVLDTWHLGAGYSQRIMEGTYSYGINADARQPRVVMPGPETNAVTLTGATGSARWATDVGTDTYIGGGRFAYLADGTSPRPAAADLGAGVVGWDALNWSGNGLIATDINGTAGPLWKVDTVGVWTSGTANRRTLSAAYYNSTNGFRLFGHTDTAGLNELQTIPEDTGVAGTDPVTAANWGTALKIGAYGGITINKLVNNQDHIYVSTSRGLFDFDGATGKAFNLTPQQDVRRDTENGIAACAANGFIFYGHKHGLQRYQATGQDFGRQWDVSFGFGLPNESPIRGQVTAVCQDRGWLVQAIWNGTDTYVCWGRELAGSDTSVGANPMLWHGGLIKLAGVQCYLLFISGQTSPPRLWMGAGANVRWCYLARTDNPLQDSDYRFSTSYSLILPAEHWGRPTTRKNLLELEVEGENLGIGVSIAWKYSVDGTPQAVLGTANNGPVSLLLPQTEIIGRRIAFQADGTGTNTSGANIRAIVLRAAERVSVRAIREYDIVLGEWSQDSLGGISMSRVLKRLDNLRTLMTSGGVVLRDEYGETLTVLVLPPISWREVAGESFSDKAHYPTIVATVRVKILKRLSAQITWDSGATWDSGKTWG
jgi:hypothetical protein